MGGFVQVTASALAMKFLLGHFEMNRGSFLAVLYAVSCREFKIAESNARQAIEVCYSQLWTRLVGDVDCIGKAFARLFHDQQLHRASQDAQFRELSC
jgi:hypothetical protein